MTQVSVIVRRETERRGLGEDLTPVVDVESICQLQARSRGNQGIQILHRPAVFPQESVEKIVAVRGPAHHLTSRIDAASSATRIARHSAEIVNYSVLPQDGVVSLIAGGTWKIGRTSDFPGVIDPDGFGTVSTESAEVGHHTFFPEKSVARGVACQIRRTDDFPSIIRTGFGGGHAGGSSYG